MRTRSIATVGSILLTACLSVVACDLSALTSIGLGGATKPQVTIQSPAVGSQFKEGDDVPVQSVSTDRSGIVRVELSVDGSVARTDAPPIPQGQTSFLIIQTWKATAGSHTVSVRAFNAAGAASDPALVAITVIESAAGNPSPTLEVGLPPLGGTQANPATLLTPTLGPTQTTPIAPAATRTHTATPTISAPPGIWAVSIRVDPADPKNNSPVKFWVTFLNTTGNPQSYRWRIRIYPPDAKNSKGDTTPIDTSLPVGQSEFASLDNWTIHGPAGCDPYIARVFWIDPSSKQETPFSKPDQSGGPEVGFQMCP